jgi:hypothetical protein
VYILEYWQFDQPPAYLTHPLAPLSILFVSGYGVISSMAVEEGFRSVDRKHFVPQVRHFSALLVIVPRLVLDSNPVGTYISWLLVLWQDNLHVAHSDLPLREGNVHISAPHMYGSILEALELRQNYPMSFLNAGSGTGYLSCIVATILGSPSSHYCKLKACVQPTHAVATVSVDISSNYWDCHILNRR